MYEAVPRLRPMGVGDLLDATISLFRRNFRLFLGIGAVVLVPLGVLQVLYQLALFNLRGFWAIGVVMVLYALVAGLGNLAHFLATVYAASEVYLGRSCTIREAYAGGRDYLLRAVGLVIVSSLALSLLFITVLGIPVAIYLGICWILAGQALLLERLGIRRALGRSRELVKGRWWRVLALLVLMVILEGLIQGFFSIPVAAITLFTLARPSELFSAPATVAITLFSTAGQLVANPISFLVLVLLYYDLRVRKEGFDLELMARQVNPTPEGETPGE